MTDLVDKHINDLTVEDWKELYVTCGLSLTELGKMFGVNPTTIMKRLDKLGLQRKRTGRRHALTVSKEVLYDLYVTQKKTFVDIAKIYDVSDKAVKNLCKKYDIPIRSKRRNIPEDELKRLYLEEKLDATKIAKHFGVSTNVITSRLRKLGVKIRGSANKSPLKGKEGEVVALYKRGVPSTEIAKKYGVNTTTIFTLLQREGVEIRDSHTYHKKTVDEKLVVRLYVDDMLSLSQVAEKVGISRMSVSNILDRNGISRRSKSEAKKGVLNNMYGQSHSKEVRSKMSDAYVDGVRGLSFMSGKGKYEKVKTNYGITVTARSSWEAAIIRFFNNLGVVYEYEPDYIRLTIDGVRASYRVDFYVKSGYESAPFYLEVKGMWKQEAKKKIEAARKAGYNIVVWEGEDLKKLGILDSSFKPIV